MQRKRWKSTKHDTHSHKTITHTVGAKLHPFERNNRMIINRKIRVTATTPDIS